VHIVSLPHFTNPSPLLSLFSLSVSVRRWLHADSFRLCFDLPYADLNPNPPFPHRRPGSLPPTVPRRTDSCSTASRSTPLRLLLPPLLLLRLRQRRRLVAVGRSPMSSPGRARSGRFAKSLVPSLMSDLTRVCLRSWLLLKFWITPPGWCWKSLSIWVRELSEPLLWMPLRGSLEGGASSTLVPLSL